VLIFEKLGGCDTQALLFSAGKEHELNLIRPPKRSCSVVQICSFPNSFSFFETTRKYVKINLNPEIDRGQRRSKLNSWKKRSKTVVQLAVQPAVQQSLRCNGTFGQQNEVTHNVRTHSWLCSTQKASREVSVLRMTTPQLLPHLSLQCVAGVRSPAGGRPVTPSSLFSWLHPSS